jgi:hypothetical protein
MLSSALPKSEESQRRGLRTQGFLFVSQHRARHPCYDTALPGYVGRGRVRRGVAVCASAAALRAWAFR